VTDLDYRAEKIWQWDFSLNRFRVVKDRSARVDGGGPFRLPTPVLPFALRGGADFYCVIDRGAPWEHVERIHVCCGAASTVVQWTYAEITAAPDWRALIAERVQEGIDRLWSRWFAL